MPNSPPPVQRIAYFPNSAGQCSFGAGAPVTACSTMDALALAVMVIAVTGALLVRQLDAQCDGHNANLFAWSLHSTHSSLVYAGGLSRWMCPMRAAP